jgi:hypothetical protein
VLDRPLGPDGGDRAEGLRRLEAGVDADAARYRELLDVLSGRKPQPSNTEDYVWLIEALRERS